MENNPIDDLSKAIDEKKVRVTFGLQPSDIEKIEVRIKAFDGALYSQGMWEWAAKDIGWHPLTAALYYFKYLNDSNASLQSEIDRLQKENKHLKNRIDSDWYVRELNNEISEMKKQIDELHNSIMTKWEKDYGSIHNEQSMDAYTVSGFIKSILTRIK